jgi:hypothetical protein
MSSASAASDDLLKFLFAPGKNYITDGERGGGKTFQAVAYAEMLIKRKHPPWGRIVLLTNIIFLQKTASGMIKATPPGVFRATTMKGMLQKIGEILKLHGRDVTILVILDEAQNFMLSDVNADKVNLALIRWFGTARKFQCVTWLISPTIKNMVPRVRNFYNEENPGYMNGIFRKDSARAKHFVEKFRPDTSPRDYTTLQYGDEGLPRLLQIPKASWTRSPEELGEGEYCYDQLSSADFSLGDDFEIKDFVNAVSDVESEKMAAAILDFFAGKTAAAETEGQAAAANARIERMLRVDRMRRMKISWANIAVIEDMSEPTVRRWYKNYMGEKEAFSYD